MKKNILIAEDQDRIREFISLYFRAEGFNVIHAGDGKSAINAFEHNNIHLIVLDIMMPEMDGFEVCRYIRKKSDVPIIILTALGEDEQQILGYELGADDYVVKPIKPKVLVAKARRLLEKESDDMILIDFGFLKIDKTGRTVYVDDKNVDFTPKEYDFLLLLAENKGKALSRDTIINKVWGYDFMGNTRVVDNHVKKLRSKLGKHSDCIKTISSIGYKFEVK